MALLNIHWDAGYTIIIKDGIGFMTTQMAPDLVEICFDLETKSGEARFRLGEAIKANDPLSSNGIRNRAGRFTMHPAV